MTQRQAQPIQRYTQQLSKQSSFSKDMILIWMRSLSLHNSHRHSLRNSASIQLFYMIEILNFHHQVRAIDYSQQQIRSYYVYQFLTLETKAKIAQTFKILFDIQLQGQNIRERVYNSGLFSLKDAFDACDRDENGFITLDQFRTVFEDYSLRISEKEVAMLLERYDRMKQMRISYQLFVEELTPKLRA